MALLVLNAKIAAISFDWLFHGSEGIFVPPAIRSGWLNSGTRLAVHGMDPYLCPRDCSMAFLTSAA